MLNLVRKCLLTLTAVTTLVLAPSCDTTLDHKYYILSPAGPAPARQGIGIGVGPVITAPYLDRPYLIFQDSENTLEINEYHEWAGDMHNEFARVLATNIGRKANTGNIQTYPWSSDAELSYQIAVDVKRFHGTADGDAILEASWRIYKLPGSQLVTSKSTTITEPLNQDGFKALVAAQSIIIDRLATKITTSLR